MIIMRIVDKCWQQKDNNSNKDNDKDKTRTCDIWDTDYNSDNWKPEFMTIFVTWQLIVTLDSIRNSCDVLVIFVIIIIKITIIIIIIIIATIIIIIEKFSVIRAKRRFWRPKKEDPLARIGGILDPGNSRENQLDFFSLDHEK